MTRNAKVCQVENTNLVPYKSLSRIELGMALKSYNSFKKYLSGDLNGFDEYDLNAMRSLYLLQCLGFSVKDLGTYFFKDVVMDTFTRFYFSNEGKFEEMFVNNDNNVKVEIDDDFINSKLNIYKSYIDKANSTYNKLYVDPEIYKMIYSEGKKPQMDAHLVKELVMSLAKSSYLDRKNEKGFVRFKENN